MFYVKQILQFLRTKGSLTLVLVASLLIFILLIQKNDLALIRHQSSNFDELLTVVVGVLATIIVTTFSAIIVSLQLASAQFSPRILRGFFSEDGKVQFILMSFFLCISYCLTIKYLGLTNHDDVFYVFGQRFHYATFGIIFGIVLVLAIFPLFIYYIIRNINVAHIIRKISRRSINEINLLYEKEWNFGDEDNFTQKYPNGYKNFLKVRANKNGFLDHLNPIAFHLITFFGHKIYFAQFIGNFISNGEVIAYVDYTGNNDFRKKAIQFLVRNAMFVSGFRSYTQDINFGIRQLVDISIKAISPAVNDPTTAINGINYLGEILKDFVLCKLPSKNTVAFKKINLYQNEFNFDKMLDLAFDQISYWGKNDYVIMRHVIITISEIIKINKNPNHLSVLIQEVLDFELFEKNREELREIYHYDEYAKSLHENVLRKFVVKSLKKINETQSEIKDLGYENLYQNSLEKLKIQENILEIWLKENTKIA